MDQASALPNAALDPAGRIDQDLACLKCGYNLRSLSPRQITPECGQLVSLSIRGDWLAYSDPEWVRTVASGLRWILWCLLGGFIWLQLSAGNALGWWSAPAGAAIAMLLAIGYWKATSPEPRVSGTESRLSLRRVARIGSIAGLVLGCWPNSLGLRPLMIPFAHTSPRACIVIAGWLLVLVYASRLAQRTPHGGATKTTMGMAAGLAISMTTPLILAIVIRVMPGALGSSASPNSILSTIAGACGFATVAFLVWSVILLHSFRKQIVAAVKSD